MRILVDLQGAQTESRFRGIGRYVTSLTKALIRNGGQHEFFILLNGLFPETIESIRQQFSDVLPQSNILVWYTPGPVNGYNQSSLGRRKIAEHIRTNFIDTLKPDAVYVSSLFEGADAVVNIPAHSCYQIGVTFYDLIPLLNPDQYFLGNPQFKEYYFEKIDCLRRADKLFAISEFSRQEALDHLALDPSLVINVSTASDENVMLADLSDSKEVLALLKRLKISRPFVLYTGGGDGRKNLPRLAQAYARIPKELRSQYQLVMAGRMLAVQAEEVEQAAKNAGLNLEEDIVLTGYVSDSDLQQLYRQCRLFVFPSWHEGFGLPALEAMQCGAVVVAAGNTSLPEVLDFEAALFDPMDVDQMAKKIAHGLENEAFRSAFLKHAQIQAKKFSWDISARRLLNEFELAYKQHPQRNETWQDFAASHALAQAQMIDQIAELSITYGLDKKTDDLALAYALVDNEKTLLSVQRKGALPRTPLTWRVEGPFDSSYSLALLNRETARGLASLGQNVVLHSTEGPGDFEPNASFLENNSDLAAMHAKSRVLASEMCDVSSRNLYPPRVHDMGSRINMLHHYAWEESAFPPDWVEEFNDNLQGMSCLSNHVRKVMVDNGVSVPMTVSGCGVDHWLRIEADATYRVDTSKFIFLHVSSCFPRKGVGALLEAYGQAFSNADPVMLVIKTFPNPHNEARVLLEECQALYPNYPEVLLIEDDLSEEQLKALYEQSQALVAPSRAEGFGLPLAEAMLSGLSVITTGWGGQTDFCNQDTAWLIDYTYQRASTHFDLFDSVWAAPDVHHLAQLMKEVFESSEDAKAQKNQKSKELLLSQFTWQSVSQRLIDTANHCTETDSNLTVRLGWVSSWNTPCGIASYSSHLLGGMAHEATIFARHDPSEIPDEANVVRCWHMDDKDNLSHLSEEIERKDINVLVVQFNYGFYEFDAFAKFLKRMTVLGRKVLVMLHATIDPPGISNKRLERLREALSGCYRLLVHTPADLNRLKALGLDRIAAIFPHGVVDRNHKLQNRVE